VNPTFQSAENRTKDWPVIGPLMRSIRPMFVHHLTIDEVIEELRPKLSAVPGIVAFMQNLPPIQIGGELTKSPFQFTLTSPIRRNFIRLPTICSNACARFRNCRT